MCLWLPCGWILYFYQCEHLKHRLIINIDTETFVCFYLTLINKAPVQAFKGIAPSTCASSSPVDGKSS
jgi:hypothetical protein